jgi:hypothetical protein
LEAWQTEYVRSAAILQASNTLKSGDLKNIGNPKTQEATTIANLGPLGAHPAIRKALLNTPVGELTPILWTPDGKLWTARIKARIPAKPLTFAERKAIIERLQNKEAHESFLAEMNHLEQAGSKHSGLGSFYGRKNGIWRNENKISNYSIHD